MYCSQVLTLMSLDSLLKMPQNVFDVIFFKLSYQIISVHICKKENMLLALVHICWISESIRENTNSVIQYHDSMFLCLCVCLVVVNTFDISVLCIRDLDLTLGKEARWLFFGSLLTRYFRVGACWRIKLQPNSIGVNLLFRKYVACFLYKLKSFS